MWIDPDTWATAVLVGRVTNIILATAALLVLATTVRGWRTRSAGNRFLWLGVIVFLLNSIFGTLEQMWQGAHGGFRTAVTTVALAYILTAVILKRMGRWYTHESEYARYRRSAGA